ncbi:hypothetical protein BpHYR1_029221 [Brachionus plicatilis]|uniref:Uncharacterized protein n=1 Tax=Brachionus plicatilis TaxID=10195 RepID=A0A3M7S425_BRAPC|nr:hypothetical protein BpHYR1_029221 [Brachionus plicatilis]
MNSTNTDKQLKLSCNTIFKLHAAYPSGFDYSNIKEEVTFFLVLSMADCNLFKFSTHIDD